MSGQAGKVKVFFTNNWETQRKDGKAQITRTDWDTFDFTDIVHDEDRVIIYNDGKIEAEFSNRVFERLYIVEHPV